jgi:ADP-ribosylglycohydrolase
LYAGQPARAAEAVAAEAQITNAEAGIWAAQAVAAGISVACGGGGVDDLLDAACAVLPSGSWIARIVAEALDAAREVSSLVELSLLLSSDVVNREYNYGTSAPETLAVALALTRYAEGNLEQGIMGATAVAKVADAGASLVGAFCGALTDDFILPSSMEKKLRTLSGLCIPSLQGVDYLHLVDEWTAKAAKQYSSAPNLT